jgi:hypothetical protein
MKRLLIVITILVTIVAHAQITPEQLYESASKNCFVVVNKSDNSFGTGFLLTNGYIVTNLHVVQGASPTEITLRPINNTNEVIACEKLYISPKRDIAIIKPLGSINDSGLELDTTLPKIGSIVYVIGNSEGLTGTFSDGLVSQIRDGEDIDTWIQMSAPISHGNSGGPVMNKEGKVIGISTLSHRFGQNLNFAIPSKYISAFLKTNNIATNVAASNKETATDHTQTTTNNELEQVRTLFSPEQLELVKEVDNRYLWRNIICYTSTSILLLIISIILWKYKTSGYNSFKQFIKEYSSSEKNSKALLLFQILPIPCLLFLFLSLTYYPSFFKSRLEEAEDPRGDYNKNKYALLLNETYNGSDLAMLFLADEFLKESYWYDFNITDTTEAIKWFNALASKNYYAGYLVLAKAKLGGWDSKDTKTKAFINASNDYSARYLNHLAEIQKSETDLTEKKDARDAIFNIVGMYSKSDFSYYGFYIIGNAFMADDKPYKKADSALRYYDWLNTYLNTYNTIHKYGYGDIPSHKKYLLNDSLGIKTHNELISKGFNISLPWNASKEFFQKAALAKEMKFDNKYSYEHFKYVFDRYAKDTAELNKYLRKINEADKIWLEDTKAYYNWD